MIRRRTLLKFFAALPLAQSSSILKAIANGSSPTRSLAKLCTRQTDPDWPSAQSWEQLNKQVGGHLLKVESPLNSCKLDPAGAACAETLKQMKNPYFIGDQAALTQTSGWVDAWISAPSAYVVAAQETKDVVAAVNFAREKNLRLVVKGGGHSYKGTSNAADSLLIWPRAMNKIELHDAFRPERTSEQQSTATKAVSVGAGAMWMDVYNAVVTEAGRYVQGGGCATVGVAGLIQSGGFGSFSKNFGMAAASLLEAELVTADGIVHVVNEFNEPDLFWALKGGGGGSFGVVTRLTLKTHELPAKFGGVGMKIKASSNESYHRLIQKFVSFYKNNLFNPHWGESAKLNPNNTLSIGMVFSGLDKEEAQKIWAPWFQWLSESSADYELAPNHFVETMNARNWWDAEWRLKNLPKTVQRDARQDAQKNHIYWQDNQGEVSVFLHGYESVWLPQNLLEDVPQKKLTDAFFAASREWSVELHFNKGLAGAPPEAIEGARRTAMNPVVVDSFALAIIAGGEPKLPGVAGHEPDLKEARKEARFIAKSMQALRRVIPSAGAYVSESSYFEPSWQQAFWGENYARLKAIKQKYDPAGLFYVHQGVGND